MPTNLKELEIGEVSEEDLRELSMAATLNDTVKLSKIKELTAEDVYQIFGKQQENKMEINKKNFTDKCSHL